MPRSLLRMFKSVEEFTPKEDLKLKGGIRGLYVLYKRVRQKYEVVYVGKSETNIRTRLRDHARDKELRNKWDYFSVFEVHNNISDEEIRELENLILFIYRKDPHTNPRNALRGSKRLFKIKRVPLGS